MDSLWTAGLRCGSACKTVFSELRQVACLVSREVRGCDAGECFGCGVTMVQREIPWASLRDDSSSAVAVQLRRGRVLSKAFRFCDTTYDAACCRRLKEEGNLVVKVGLGGTHLV